MIYNLYLFKEYGCCPTKTHLSTLVQQVNGIKTRTISDKTEKNVFEHLCLSCAHCLSCQIVSISNCGLGSDHFLKTVWRTVQSKVKQKADKKHAEGFWQLIFICFMFLRPSYLTQTTSYPWGLGRSLSLHFTTFTQIRSPTWQELLVRLKKHGSWGGQTTFTQLASPHDKKTSAFQ